ncbi:MULTISPECIES: hypothetical protein [Providencia]|uniref:hypothetical protein n=1 Tax=Providencia TaxID=586 RepID=UPI001981B867|nr:MULTISPECIES: hypothetical protein [Providencia]MBN4863297.1 hypothetical protein [Providencia stuartii]MBN4876444.1 hypothetical protein [Providencia stuartii]MBN4878260.1 hypothetical protein [Providencia stuartii]MBN4881820.1 hypothetical protein [Providencia stuartii]
MARYEAGKLALVISSLNPSEIGRCVTLTRRLYDGEYFMAPDGSEYRCDNATATRQWLVSGDVSIYLGSQFSGVSVFAESELMLLDDGESIIQGEFMGALV